MANWRAEARKAARRHGIDPGTFERQIDAESGFNPTIRSPAGATGIAQIMPATARSWGVNPLNPSASLDAAARNMASYIRSYGGWENALRAYNAGPGRIAASHGFRETNNYVAKILRGGTPPASSAAAAQRTPTSRVGGGASGAALPAPPAATRYTPDRLQAGLQTTFDQAGYAQAQRLSFLAQRLAKSRGTNSPLFRTGLLSQQAPSAMDFTRTQMVSKLIPGTSARTIEPRVGQAPAVSGLVTGAPAAGPSSGRVRAAVKQAQQRLGIPEIGYSNRGPEIDKWQRSFGMIGQAWCGIFTGVVLRSAGVRGVNSRIASVTAIEQDARAGRGPFRGWTSPRHARAGDLLVTSRGNHVGFIESVDRNGTIHTVEGNTSNGRVSRRTHSPGSVYGVAQVRYGT